MAQPKRKPKSGPKGGRPRHKPTEDSRGRVQAYSAAGYDQHAISKRLGISKPILEKYYANELRNAAMDLLGGAVTGLAAAIKRGEAWAICFVLKTRGKRLHNGEGWGEAPLPPDPSAVLPSSIHIKDLTDEQLRELLARLRLAATSAPGAIPAGPPRLTAGD